MLAGAVSPWTRQAERSTRVIGQRRREHVVDVVPDGAAGTRHDGHDARTHGQRPLACGVEQAFRSEARLQRLEAQREIPEPSRLQRRDVQLVDALRIEDIDAAMRDDPQARLGLERRRQPVVAEEDARELAARVLEAEVAVAGARDRDAADLAFDPDVLEPLLAPNCLAHRAGDVRDAQDPGSGARPLGRRLEGPRRRSRDPRARRVPVRERPVWRLRSGHRPPAGPRLGSGSRRSGCRSGSCRPRRRRSAPGRSARSRSWPTCALPSGCRPRSPGSLSTTLRSTETGSSMPIVSPW